MPIKLGSTGLGAIYNGGDKIAKIYKGSDLVYQSFVYNPLIALIERTIQSVDAELTNQISKIGYRSFQNCKLLTNVVIPNNITEISAMAFDGCDNLKEMKVEATTPPTLGNANAISTSTTKIYVPASSVSAYQSASVWADLMIRQTNPVTFVGY